MIKLIFLPFKNKKRKVNLHEYNRSAKYLPSVQWFNKSSWTQLFFHKIFYICPYWILIFGGRFFNSFSSFLRFIILFFILLLPFFILLLHFFIFQLLACNFFISSYRIFSLFFITHLFFYFLVQDLNDIGTGSKWSSTNI